MATPENKTSTLAPVVAQKMSEANKIAKGVSTPAPAAAPAQTSGKKRPPHFCVVENVGKNDPSQVFPYCVTCMDCGWQGRYHEEVAAQQAADTHQHSKATRKVF